MDARTDAPANLGAETVYSPTARFLHWLTAGLVLFMLAVGFVMTDESNTLRLAEKTRDGLWPLHKTVGFVLLWIVVVRLIYRFAHGAPPSVPTLTPFQKAASHATHWLLYLLLIAMPLGGWLGESLDGERHVLWGLELPAISTVNKPLSEKVFWLHTVGAFIVLGLVAMHIGAALFHQFVQKDGVLQRMWPSLGQSDDV